MNLENLLFRMEKNTYQIIRMSDRKEEIHGIRLLSKDIQRLESDILYFGEMKLLPKLISEDKFLNFAGWGMDNLPEYYKQAANCNLICIREDADPYEQYNRMQEYFVEDQKLTGKIRRLLSAFFADRGLQYLVDEASEVVNNPIFVVDNNFKYLAGHIGEHTSESQDGFFHIMKSELDEQHVQEAGIEHIRNANLDELSGRGDVPFCHYNDVLERETMIGTVRVHNIVVAHVMMVEDVHKFDEMDQECFMRLIHFVGQEMQKIPFYRKNKGQMFSYFLIDLLNDLQPNLHSIERQLKTLHFNMKEEHYMVILQSGQTDLTPKETELLAEQLRGILTGNIYAAYHNTMVILFNREKNDTLGDYTVETLKKYARINCMSVGVSNSFGDITAIRMYYEQACKAIEFGQMLHPNSFLFYYKDIAYMEMLDICRKQSDLLSFCAPAVLDLMRYDEANHTEFMRTLYYYLENNGNTALTAKDLFIHKNTLLYRMDKIKGLIHDELISGETYFILHLSFRILIQLHLFEPGIEVENEI